LGFSSDGNHLISITSDSADVPLFDILGGSGSIRHEVRLQFWDCSRIFSQSNDKMVKLLKNYKLFERVAAQNERGAYTSIIEIPKSKLALIHAVGIVTEFSNYREDHISIVVVPHISDNVNETSKLEPLSFSYSVYSGLECFPNFEPSWTVVSDNLILLNSGNAIHLLEIAPHSYDVKDESSICFRTWCNSSSDYSIFTGVPQTNKTGKHPKVFFSFSCFFLNCYLLFDFI
jgi:hypothetical protein